MFDLEELIKTQEKVVAKEKNVDSFDLIIFNDDVNTFEFVISSLMKICNHSSIQAEQCTLIIHHNGKCSVKRGVFDKLKPMAEAFLERGIIAKIKA